MFQEMDNFQQEVKGKQARFQDQAAQERLIKACATVKQTGEIYSHREIKRSWFLALSLRLVKQPK